MEHEEELVRPSSNVEQKVTDRQTSKVTNRQADIVIKNKYFISIYENQLRPTSFFLQVVSGGLSHSCQPGPVLSRDSTFSCHKVGSHCISLKIQIDLCNATPSNATHCVGNFFQCERQHFSAACVSWRELF
jgi:hypothetical protein